MVVLTRSGLEGSLDADAECDRRKRNKLKKMNQPQRRTRPVNRHYFRQSPDPNLKVKPRPSCNTEVWNCRF